MGCGKECPEPKEGEEEKEGPTCNRSGVRIHYVDQEASTGMDNRPEADMMDEAKHSYHAWTFISISPGNRKKFREAMVHRQCTDSPLSKLFSANPMQMIKNYGGPNFSMPFL